MPSSSTSSASASPKSGSGSWASPSRGEGLQHTAGLGRLAGRGPDRSGPRAHRLGVGGQTHDRLLRQRRVRSPRRVSSPHRSRPVRLGGGTPGGVLCAALRLERPTRVQRRRGALLRLRGRRELAVVDLGLRAGTPLNFSGEFGGSVGGPPGGQPTLLGRGYDAGGADVLAAITPPPPGQLYVLTGLDFFGSSTGAATVTGGLSEA